MFTIVKYFRISLSGVVAAGKAVIGSQSYSREIQTVVQYKKYYMHLMIL
jgi:hypothetical protein